MNRNIILGTIALSLLLVLIGILPQEQAESIGSTNTSKHDRSNSSELIAESATTDTKMSQLVSSSNRFGFELFKQLLAQPESSDNIFISPNSIAIALSMIRNGTAGQTLAEMNKVLGLDPLSTANVDRSYSQLIETLKTADVELAIANSLWINQDLTLKEQFINNAQNFYQAQVTNLNFADTSVTNTINQWVAQNTAGKISEIVDTVSPEDVLYLINAIYFKGSWTNKFNVDATTQQPFYLQPDSQKSVAMMSQTGDYRYYQNEQFQAICLPYGEKAQLGMYIFLPTENSSLAALNQQLNLDNWQDWIEQMRSQAGNISLPKFRLQYDTELKDILASLGMQQVFNPSQADFSAMTDSKVAIDTVKHKAVIEVNEAGTEAAGVTSTGVRITSAVPNNQPFNMNVDRPFFFAIRDDNTQAILFMGNVKDPN